MNKKGQSIIEYALIAVLVILGIVFMGPYVLRSIEAHFKLWDDTAQDSFSENIVQAPANDLPVINATCDCWNTPGSCGGGGSCSSNVIGYTHTCNPLGCDGAPSIFCGTVPVATCCTTYAPQSCGTIPIPGNPPTLPTGSNCSACVPGPCTQGTPSTNTCGTGTCPTNLSGNCSSPPSFGITNCYYGQRIWSTGCSSINIICVKDPTCNPTCLGIGSPGILFCGTNPPSENPDTSMLRQTYSLNYLSDPSACNLNPPPCSVYCDAANSFVFTPQGPSCTRQFEVAPEQQNCSTTPNLCTCTHTPNGCDPNHSYCTTTVNCNFTRCSYQGKNISTVTINDVSQPETYPYCGTKNPPGGHPSEQCQMIFNYN